MNGKRKPFLDTFFVFTLFFAYTLSSLLLSIMGANVYTNTVQVSQDNYDVRTSVLYLSQKVRQSEQIDAISIQQFNGADALVITETFGEYKFDTWIYIENGYLCEALLSEGISLISGAGQNIMPLSSMAFDLDDTGLLSMDVITESGDTYHSKIFLECVLEEAT